MIIYETKVVTKEVKTPIAKQCDRCKKEYTDIFETQEFHHILFEGGYASVFGDETEVECDICQHCLKEMIGDICRYD